MAVGKHAFDTGCAPAYMLLLWHMLFIHGDGRDDALSGLFT